MGNVRSMNLNPNAIPTILLAFLLFWFFAWPPKKLVSRTARAGLLVVATVIAIPGLLYVLYYAHLFDNAVWFYRFRAFAHSEFAASGLGAIAGFVQTTYRPQTLGEKLVSPLALGVLLFVPFMKSTLDPVDYSQLLQQCDGAVCMQSTPSTCGPSSAATLLKQFGQKASEQELARESFTYRGGTEVWYLARALRKRGFDIEFVIQPTDHLSPPVPAVAGVVLQGGAGHFIAIMNGSSDEITIGDPMKGELLIRREELRHAYHFTGFFMRIDRSGRRTLKTTASPARAQIYAAAIANAAFAAAIVCCTSCSLCAAPINAASNCDGGR